MLYKDPCVYAVGDEYQIVFNTLEHGMAWIEAGGEKYIDSTGGLVRTETLLHRVSIPMHVLDAAGGYKVCFRALAERKPYFPELGETMSREYAFRPVDTTRPVNIYMLADTHSQVDAPVRAAEYFGDRLDMLIMNGDIPTASQTHEDIRSIFDITSAVTRGGIPVVFARGNHDYRGRLATDLPQFIGNRNGDTWFTFRIGNIWGVVLDCGEDKEDDHPEYGGLVDCHSMRMAQTRFLESIVENADREYMAPGVSVRFAITHVPFCASCVHGGQDVFNIEVPLFTEWTKLLNNMHLDAMLSGHMHVNSIALPGTDEVRMGAEFPVVICAEPYVGEGRACAREPHTGAKHIGLAMTVSEDRIGFHATSDTGSDEELLVLRRS